MELSGAPLTDEDINKYHFWNETELLNDLAWTSIEPGIHGPYLSHNIPEIIEPGW